MLTGSPMPLKVTSFVRPSGVTTRRMMRSYESPSLLMGLVAVKSGQML